MGLKVKSTVSSTAFIIFLFLNFAQAETYKFNSLAIITDEAPPPNLLSLLVPNDKILAYQKRYKELTKQLGLQDISSDIHNETFFEAYMHGFIDRDKHLELSGQALNEIHSRLNKTRPSAIFSATFFTGGKVTRDLHEQAINIAAHNFKQFSYETLNKLVSEEKLFSKYFPEYSFINASLGAQALAFFTHSIRNSDPEKHATILKYLKTKAVVNKHFEALLSAYQFCESYWYKSCLKIFLSDRWISDGKVPPVSLFDLINDQWGSLLSAPPSLVQHEAPSISSIPVYPLLNDFFKALIIPEDPAATKQLSSIRLKRLQNLFSEAYKLWDETQSKNQQNQLYGFAIDAKHLFSTSSAALIAGFGIPTFALLADTAISLHTIAFIKNNSRRFALLNETVQLMHDAYLQAGVALAMSSDTIKKLQNMHPIIEYWYLVNVLHANNLEKTILSQELLEALGKTKLDELSKASSIQMLFEDETRKKKILTKTKKTSPVYTLPQSSTTVWPQFYIKKTGKNVELVETLDEKTAQNEAITKINNETTPTSLENSKDKDK